jgi:hypothetical protein
VQARDVFLKRLVWGRNGSSVVLSPSADWRKVPAPEDYVWTAEEPPIVLLRVENGDLHVWGNGTAAWLPPSEGRFPVRVVFHDVDVVTQNEWIDNAPARGVLVVGGRKGWPLQPPPPKVTEP